MLNNILSTLNTLWASIGTIIASFAIFIVAASIHELSHGFTAYMQGDHTAKNAGRLTLNPLKHISIFGTIIFPLIGIISGLPVIGWMKPVPVNPNSLKDGSKGHALVAFAGPFSNFIQAALATILLKLILIIVPFVPSAVGALIFEYTKLYIQINLVLMAFNMLPIPPLDGGWILLHFSPPSMKQILHNIYRFGFFIIYALIIFDLLDPYFMFVLSISTGALSFLLYGNLFYIFIPTLICLLIGFLLYRGTIKYYLETRKSRVDIQASFEKQAKRDIANKKAHNTILKSYNTIIEKLKNDELLDDKEQELLKEVTSLSFETDNSICNEADFNHNDNYCHSCDNFKKCISRMLKGLA